MEGSMRAGRAEVGGDSNRTLLRVNARGGRATIFLLGYHKKSGMNSARLYDEKRATNVPLDGSLKPIHNAPQHL